MQVMLIEFSVGNYRSFKERVTFSRIVKIAKKRSKQEDYDQVWCVFDRDDFPKEDFNNAIKNAADKGIQVAYSNEAYDPYNPVENNPSTTVHLLVQELNRFI